MDISKHFLINRSPGAITRLQQGYYLLLPGEPSNVVHFRANSLYVLSNQIRTATDTVTPTFIRIPTSRPYHGTTLNITASYAHEISRITSHGSSPAREVSSPSLHNPHVAMSSTKGR